MRANPVLDDKRLQVRTLNRTADPQRLCWLAMHQDYSEEYVWDEVTRSLPESEEAAGKACVSHLLKGHKGHYGPLEHPQVTVAVGYFPHSVMQQARTHRVGISFDVQSLRYTGRRFCAVANGSADVEDVFYLRPVGDYVDRNGAKYAYCEKERLRDLERCIDSATEYARKIKLGYSEEHARGSILFEFRQHFVASFNLRSALHFMDLRSKADAQDEIRAFCSLLWPELAWWAPEICSWYEEHRLGKARLSP